MKISKLLNKSYKIFFLIFLIFSQNYLYSTEPTEPVDIWKTDSTDKNQNEVNILDGDENIDSGDSIYKSQSNENETEIIFEDQTLLSKEIKIVGLYDPEENDLSIDMWSNSDGKEILRIFNKIMSIELSNDSKNILNILFLTNSYFPDKNITKDEFIKIKSDWLIKNGNLDLIEKYLIKNYKISRNPYLIKFYINEYLSNSEVEKACEIFSKIESNFEDDYISKFNIYCLINQDKKDEAQLQFDLKKELGFKDIFFEEKFNILMGYSNNSEIKISEKSILDFHLSHLTTKDFKFEPNDKTKKKIWKYLSTSNLLENVENVDLDDFNKITTIEKATNEGNYSEKDLFNLYKRFQFSINQLLTVKQSHKLLTNVESKALLYQGILITSEVEKKLELVKILKNSFLKEGMENVFNEELINILNDIDKDDVPPNFTAFYNQNLSQLDQERNKIKINNKIIHQSKLLNYFINNKEYKNIEKDLNNILNRAKKDKKYYVSTKDLILIESLKSDGFQIKKSLENFYNSENSNMPSDIQDLINNDDLSLVLLRLAEIIGQDDLENIGSETLYFIISALNQLNVDKIRNDILLKVLPLKV
tara:strand:+ start:3702 stop:5474 length:1773 start_codon:yes stop_codon:yes gene_type:complete